ncbi:MAG TPA: hypothetical protein VJN92_11295 [Candidatus Acidoferrum sp.]|nr:hypothetical protein [Candidatus Acidoferrum sp.]
MEPLPRSASVIIGAMAIVFVGLVLASGKFYLAHWRGNVVFLPVVVFIGLLLITAVFIQFFKKN